MKLDEEAAEALRREKKRKKKERKAEKAGRNLVVQKMGKNVEKRLRLTKKRLKELADMDAGEFRVDLPDIFKLVDDPDASAFGYAFVSDDTFSVVILSDPELSFAFAASDKS
jgi:hypothetical protein